MLHDSSTPNKASLHLPLHLTLHHFYSARVAPEASSAATSTQLQALAIFTSSLPSYLFLETRYDERAAAMSLPPAQPGYILRGHAAQIHSVTFIRANSRLVTGDADGWIVIWSLATKRPVSVWKAHEGAILGLAAWGHDRLIT
jgi:WD40 repeat protein